MENRSSETGSLLQLKSDLVSTSTSKDRRTIARCTFFTCFDVYRCGQNEDDVMKVYVYPKYTYLSPSGDKLSLNYSREFLQIIDSIVNSEYYTEKLEDACLLVPFVDTLNFERVNVKLVSQVLNNLPAWNGGQNHLLFNMISGTNPHILKFQRVNSWKALVAGAGLSTWLSRNTHDIHIPFYNSFTLSSLEFLRSKRNKRKWLLISSQVNLRNEHLLTLHALNNHSASTFRDQHNTDHHNNFLLLHACSHISYFHRCDEQGNVFKYPRILQRSSFCLVLEGRRGRLDEGVLLECMGAGSIPVILIDPFVMPFSSFIDWSRASIVMEERHLSSVLEVLSTFPRERIRELHHQVLFLYKKYFSSIESITHTTLREVNRRLYPNSATSYQNNNDRRPRPQTRIFLPITVPVTQGFTAVILTYDRFSSLHTLIRQLTTLPSLSKIIVVWNNQHVYPPAAEFWPKLSKPLKVIQTTANKLSNRFYPYKEIETEAVLSLDDDMLTLSNDEIEFAFQVWCEYPDRIVGFPSRLHVYDVHTKSWKYQSEWVSSLSIVLTAAAFYHKQYNDLYTTSLPRGLVDWVDARMNCEDILFNSMVAHVSQKAPIKVTPRQRFKCTNCTNVSMPAFMNEHMTERSACINHFVDAFNLTRPPLVTVEYRADPLLFKQSFPPHEFKKFNDVGPL